MVKLKFLKKYIALELCFTMEKKTMVLWKKLWYNGKIMVLYRKLWYYTENYGI